MEVGLAAAPAVGEAVVAGGELGKGAGSGGEGLLIAGAAPQQAVEGADGAGVHLRGGNDGVARRREENNMNLPSSAEAPFLLPEVT